MKADLVSQAADGSGNAHFATPPGSPQFSPRGCSSAQAALEKWTRDADSIPNLIRRLQHVAALRDAGTGQYHDSRLALEVPKEEIDSALRSFHLELFNDWISLNLREQNREVVSYLSAVAPHAARSALLSLAASCTGLIPSGVADFERRMFAIDFAFLVELMHYKLYGPENGKSSCLARSR